MEEVPFGKFGFIKRESLEWAKGHLSTIGAVAILVVVGTVMLSRWMNGDAKADYLAAEMTYHHWEGKKNGSFAKLQKILKAHPELHAKYDGPIAQKLLSASENGLGTSYAKAALKRVHEISPYYTDFSQCSLLIAENRCAQALEQSKSLKAQLEKDETFWEKKSDIVRHGCILYAFNLLRIAMLEHVAGTPEGELAAWRELKHHAGWTGEVPHSKMYDPEAYALIEDNFQNQDTTLLDYIRYREACLKTP